MSPARSLKTSATRRSCGAIRCSQGGVNAESARLSPAREGVKDRHFQNLGRFGHKAAQDRLFLREARYANLTGRCVACCWLASSSRSTLTRRGDLEATDSGEPRIHTLIFDARLGHSGGWVAFARSSAYGRKWLRRSATASTSGSTRSLSLPRSAF